MAQLVQETDKFAEIYLYVAREQRIKMVFLF